MADHRNLRKTTDYSVPPRQPLDPNYKQRAIPWSDGYYADDDFVTINGDTVTFKLQNGPIRVNGHNGCFIDRVIQFSKHWLEIQNHMNRTRDNSCAITNLDEALMWLDRRSAEKYANEVYGPPVLPEKNQPHQIYSTFRSISYLSNQNTQQNTVSEQTVATMDPNSYASVLKRTSEGVETSSMNDTH